MNKYMPTLKQRKLAEAIVEGMQQAIPPTAGQMLENVGYSKHLAKQPGRVIAQEGVQEALNDLGFTEDAAKGVVVSIMHESENDMARLSATNQVFKVLGSYAPEKTANFNANADISQPPTELKAIIEESEAKMLSALNKKKL